jgi:hypothetical protein
MSTKIGVAKSNRTNSAAAGVEAASNALVNGDLQRADFALIFCSGKHNPHEFLKGIQSVLGDTPVLGGSSIGIITKDFIGYEGYEVGVTVFSSDTLSFKLFTQPNLNLDEKKAGELLGEQIINSATENDNGLLVFYDSCKQQNPPRLNFATWLFEGLETKLPKHISCAGAGLLADMELSTTTYQFFKNEVLSQNATAVLIGGKCSMNTTIVHGCKPASAYLTITKAEGPVIFEIDNRPALEVIDELLGNNHKLEWKDFSFFVTLGVNRGEKFGVFNESDYANRLLLAVDISTKSLIMFEPDLKTGDEVQLMQRSVNLDYMHAGINNMKLKLVGKKPVFSFYINCAGRAKPYAGGEFEDAEEVQKNIGNIPFMGFYCGVEVAKVKDNLQALDWTGVLCTISEY